MKFNIILYILFWIHFRLERSKVRVTFFQSDKPQQISPPEPQFLDFFDIEPNLNVGTKYLTDTDSIDGMAASQTLQPVNYNRQIR